MARPRQVSDRDILDTARQCFLEHGPGVSTTRIAQELGLSQAALFKRFGTKGELMFQALLPPEVPPWIAQVEAGLDDRPVPDQLSVLALSIERFFIDYIPCLMTLKAAGTDMRGALAARYEMPPPVRARRALVCWLDDAVAHGRVRPCDTASTAEAILGALQGHAMLSHIQGIDPDPERFVDNLVVLLWRGLAPEAS